MEILDQPTPVITDERIASDGNRIVAALIDAVLASVLYYAVAMFGGWMLGYVVNAAYMLTRDALPFLEGQSVGKKLLKIRAVTEDGASLTNNWNASLVRNIPMVIPFFPLVELIVLLTNPTKRRLGDQWAKTKVIAVA